MKKILGILFIVAMLLINGAVSVDNEKMEINTGTKTTELMASSSTGLDVDFGLKEYAIHESENLVFYLNIKNSSDKASDYIAVDLNSATKPVRVVYNDNVSFKDAVTYKINETVKTVEIACKEGCNKIGNYVTEADGWQKLNFKLGQIPAKSTAQFEVKLKWVGEDNQDTMWGVLKQLYTYVNAYTDSAYSKRNAANSYTKILTYNVMKSLNRQEITITDQNGNVVSDLHDLPSSNGNINAILNIEYKNSGQFGNGLTYYDTDIVNNENTHRPNSAAEEPAFYANYNSRKIQFVFPSGISAASLPSSSKLTLTQETSGFKAVPKTAGDTINETLKVPLNISTNYLNKTICFYPNTESVDEPDKGFITYTTGRNGINNYCVGPYLNVTDVTAVRKSIDPTTGKMLINLNVKVTNKDTSYDEYKAANSGVDASKLRPSQEFAVGNGRAKGAVVSFKLPSGVTVGELASGMSYNTTTNTVSMKSSEIKYNQSGVVTIPLLVSKDANNISIEKNALAVEGKQYAVSEDVVLTGEATVIENAKPGDWNNDGIANVFDIVYCASYLAGVDKTKYKLPENEIVWNLYKADDSTSNGEPNIMDLTSLARGIAYSEIK